MSLQIGVEGRSFFASAWNRQLEQLVSWGPSVGRFDSERVQHQLGGHGGLRVSAILSSSEVSDKDNDGTSGSDVPDAILASTAMVPVFALVVVRAGSCSSKVLIQSSYRYILLLMSLSIFTNRQRACYSCDC